MPSRSYVLNPDQTVAGANWLDAVLNGAQPAEGNSATGWTQGQLAAGNHSRMNALVKRATTDFSATVQPSGAPDAALGDAFRLPASTGRYASGMWTLAVQLKNQNSGNQHAGRLRVRVWKSLNASGAGAVELTAATQLGPIVTTLGTVQVADVNISLPKVILRNEYVFVQLSWEVTSPGTANGNDVLLRVGTMALNTTEWSQGVVYEIQAATSVRMIPQARRRVKRRAAAAVRTQPSVKRLVERRANVAVRVQPAVRRLVKRKLAAEIRVQPDAKRIKMHYISVPASVRFEGSATRIIKKRLSAAVRFAVEVFDRARRAKRLNLGRYLAGPGGSIHPLPRLYVSNIRGEEVQLVETVQSARVSLNNQRDHTWELDLTMQWTDKFDPQSEYLKVVVDFWGDNRFERWPMGLYRVSHPNIEALEASQSWHLTGMSGESLVAEDMAEGGYTALPGSMILATVKDILTSQMPFLSVPPEMIDFPPPTEDIALVGYRLFDVASDTSSCYWLSIANTLLAAGGFGDLQTDSLGRYRTRKIEEPNTRTPTARYGSVAGGDEIVDARTAVRIDRDSSEFANRVLVTSTDPLLPQIVAVAVNDNPNSPSSIHRAKKRVTKTISLPELVNASEASKLARAELARRSGVNEKLSFSTPIDPRRGPSEAAEIGLYHSDGRTLADGRWMYEGWAADLQDPYMMEHTLTRLADV